MAGSPQTSEIASPEVREYPEVEMKGKEELKVVMSEGGSLRALTGMKTPDAARRVFCSALEAMGATAEQNASMAAAMFSEMEPRDAAEAMLVAQMTATHVAMTQMAGKMTYQSVRAHRESCERSMTRLGKLFAVQMDALKKYRRKAQQVVRVERVTVNEGGQAIVGDVVKPNSE